MEKGEGTEIPAGGHVPPNQTSGDRAPCRYAQKKERNKKTSEHKKNRKPRHSPERTFLV